MAAPLKLTTKDQPKPTWTPIATLGTKPIRSNATPPVGVVIEYMDDLAARGDLLAGKAFMESMVHPDDIQALTDWPMDYRQWTAIGEAIFGAIAGPVDPDTEPGG